MGRPEPILRETFRVDGLCHSVFLFPHQLAWCPQKKGGEDMSEWINVKLKDLLNAEITHKNFKSRSKSKCCVLSAWKIKKKPTMSCTFQTLLVSYAQQCRNSCVWRDMTLELEHDDPSVLSKWKQTLQSLLAGFKQRPKNLLFIINPFGGRRLASKIFDKQIKPILGVCKISSTVFYTQRQNHAADMLIAMTDEELEAFDAVVAVGGDGTLCEVVNGLLTREMYGQEDKCQLRPALVPVAVIGAGSTNALAYTLNGTDDPTTAVLHIVLGSCLPLDVASVRSNSNDIRFIVGQMSYGFFADTLEHSENFRWMGPKRYDYAGLKTLVGNSSYEGIIEMKQAQDEHRKGPSICKGGNGCSDCTDLSQPTTEVWRTVEGSFIGISGANTSSKCPKSPLGMAPFAHMSDGFMELILVRKTTRLGHLRYLLRTAGDSRRAFTLPFVERYRVKEFTFSPVQCCNNNVSSEYSQEPLPKSLSCACDKQLEKAHSKWNCDGELWTHPSVRVAVHKNLVKIYSRVEVESTAIPDDDHSNCPTVSTTLPATRSPSILTQDFEPSTYSVSDVSLNILRY